MSDILFAKKNRDLDRIQYHVERAKIFQRTIVDYAPIPVRVRFKTITLHDSATDRLVFYKEYMGMRWIREEMKSYCETQKWGGAYKITGELDCNYSGGDDGWHGQSYFGVDMKPLIDDTWCYIYKAERIAKEKLAREKKERDEKIMEITENERECQERIAAKEKENPDAHVSDLLSRLQRPGYKSLYFMVLDDIFGNGTIGVTDEMYKKVMEYGRYLKESDEKIMEITENERECQERITAKEKENPDAHVSDLLSWLQRPGNESSYFMVLDDIFGNGTIGVTDEMYKKVMEYGRYLQEKHDKELNLK